ncbi:MAG TPA: S8 family serine peptidase, partial [Mycobacteriales bacterium]|nr:S8 family serine peptidase [Mycobacteriales bacterium]
MRWASIPLPARTLQSAATFASGRAVVGFAVGVDAAHFADATGVRVLRNLPALRAAEVVGPPHALAALALDRRVRYLEPVGRLQLAHVRNDPLTYERDPKTGVPWEWNFHAVGADQALNLSKGSRNVLVGVVDTGITPVPDLAGKIAGALWDPTTQTSAEDDSGHGTLIASIVAANVDDAVGMAGFCGACRVLAYK